MLSRASERASELQCGTARGCRSQALRVHVRARAGAGSWLSRSPGPAGCALAFGCTSVSRENQGLSPGTRRGATEAGPASCHREAADAVSEGAVGKCLEREGLQLDEGKLPH